MKILLIGGGGREHALAWHLAQAEGCEALYCAPGNAGTEEYAENIAVAADNIPALSAFAIENEIDLVVVGPEAPLVAGLADKLRAAGIAVCGPDAAAARLEGSKAFMKDLCAKYNIPTAAYGLFTNEEDACAFIRQHGAPIVVKADGLAAGKGVIIAQSEDEAENAVRAMLSGDSFGDAGARIVIEEFLDGEEMSVFAIADGKTVLPLMSAQDHKRVGDGDTGPNTGGMGAYCPARLHTPALIETIMNRIIIPTVNGMAAEGCPFTGILFAGIMMVDGEPVLLEFNTRFGDPECQVLMMQYDGNLLRLLDTCARGTLDSARDELRWLSGTALCVVMAAQGYPGKYAKNTVIRHIDEADVMEETKVFHAGTTRDGDGNIVATGGRVLGVVSRGDNAAEAQARAYTAVDAISWPEGFCRRDIGWRAINNT